MKNFRNSLVLAALCFGSLQAQDTVPSTKLGDFDEVVIKKIGGKNKINLSIEIDNEKVTINGKPLEKFLSDDLSIKIKKQKSANGRRIIIGNNEDVIIDQNENGKITKMAPKAMLGVITEVDPKGAIIEDITEGSAAEKAGLKVGDIITKVDAELIEGPDDLKAAIKKHKPEEEVTISYLRAGKLETKKIALGKDKSVNMQLFGKSDGMSGFGDGFSMDKMPKMELKEIEDMFKGFGGDEGGPRSFGFSQKSNKPKIGISATDVGGDKGIKISEVKKESPAEKAGLIINDIITEIAGEPIFNSTDLKAALKNIEEGEATTIKYTRNGKTMETKVTITKPIKTIDF